MNQPLNHSSGQRSGSWQFLSSDWWLTCGNARFGLLATNAMLVFTILIALAPIEFATGPRSPEGVSVFSWIPEPILRSELFFTCVRVFVVVNAVLWLAQKWIPFSCWATALGAMLYWSLRMENVTNGAHIFNVTNMLLLIHAAWFHFYHHEIKAAQAGDASASGAACYPRWVFFLAIFYLGWFHTLAGFNKVMHSGWGWGNGESLQLWVNLFGWKASPSAQLMLLDSRLTAVMQTGALILECAGILVIFHRWIRYAIGLGLFGFYVGVLTTFVDFGFHFNAALVLLFLLPVDRLMKLEFNRQPNAIPKPMTTGQVIASP